MFFGLNSSWQLIKAGIKVFINFPKFLIPLLFVWIVYASVIFIYKIYLSLGRLYNKTRTYYHFDDRLFVRFTFIHVMLNLIRDD